MKNVKSLLINGVTITLGYFSLIACNEQSEEAPTYQISQVSSVERDEWKTDLTYDNKGVSSIKLYNGNTLKSASTITYRSNTLTCSIDGITYEIEIGNVKGATRAESVVASIGGQEYYRITYTYNHEGRLSSALVERSNTKGFDEVHTYYDYYNNDSIQVSEQDGTKYKIYLSSEENKGYVCNVLDFANAPLTSEFVINPNLYFLNIYGVPVQKLPANIEIREQDDKLIQAGKYKYYY